MLIGRGKMPFLHSLTIIQINAQFPINLDFCTFKGLMFSASYSSWKGMHSNKNMREITIFLIEIRLGKEKAHTQYSLEIILPVELLSLSEPSCQQQQTLHSALPTTFEVQSGESNRTDGTRCTEI